MGKWTHTSQTDPQSGKIVQRGRGGGRNDPGHAEGDQSAVKADNKAVVGMDAGHERHSNPAQFHQLPKAIGSDGDVRNLPGDGGDGLVLLVGGDEQGGGKAVKAVLGGVFGRLLHAYPVTVGAAAVDVVGYMLDELA